MAVSQCGIEKQGFRLLRSMGISLAGGPQAEARHQVEGDVLVQGGSKEASDKHSGCKIQAMIPS